MLSANAGQRSGADFWVDGTRFVEFWQLCECKSERDQLGFLGLPGLLRFMSLGLEVVIVCVLEYGSLFLSS